MVASLRKLKAWTLQQHGSRGQGSSLAEAGDRLGSFFTQAKQGCHKQSFYQLPGRNSDELRMVRGITVQHPAQIIGGHRRFVAKNSRPGSVRGDNGTATSRSSKAGRTIRPTVGHGSGVDCGGRSGWSDVHEGVVELLLSLSARGVLSSSVVTCPSLAARRLLGARSTCTTRCVDGASKAEKAVADNLQAPTRMLLAGMEVGSRRRGVSKGE